MENINKALITWTWDNAPEEYKKLSRHGGSENYVMLCPKEQVSYLWPNCLDDAFTQNSISNWIPSWGWAERHELSNGNVVVIFAHA